MANGCSKLMMFGCGASLRRAPAPLLFLVEAIGFGSQARQANLLSNAQQRREAKTEKENSRNSEKRKENVSGKVFFFRFAKAISYFEIWKKGKSKTGSTKRSLAAQRTAT